jgi:hypothetical protein
MGFNLLKTRGGKLENTIKLELAKAEPDLSVIMSSIHEYEKSNLATIEKLKRDKKLETNRINGALKQTIQAHGPITMTLIGSATKRIYGSILSDEKKESFSNKLKKFFKSLVN